MSGFAENHSTGQWSGRSTLGEILTWEESQAMLPLVTRIVRDVIDWTKALDEAEGKLGDLPPAVQQLDWAERSKGYYWKDRLSECGRELRGAFLELEALRITLLDQEVGVVGFPTLVNNRRAFFIWQMGEPTITQWCYTCDPTRRQIPKAWIRDGKEEDQETRAA
jgi:hypothetical protein